VKSLPLSQDVTALQWTVLLRKKCNVVIHSLLKKVTYNGNNVTNNALLANSAVVVKIISLCTISKCSTVEFANTFASSVFLTP